jgi:3-deoxy-D-manno-octulosonic-acid transferase
MQLLYNIIQLSGLIVFAPLLFVKVILTPKYRTRILGRMGKGLTKQLTHVKQASPRFWIHALSVGEVSSSAPLVKALRHAYPDCIIIFSSTTPTGEEIAKKILAGVTDLVIPFPLDMLWVVRRYLKMIAPDLFIMVETDFWPNFLFEVRKHNVPAFLVNGRISNKSIRLYKKFNWLFRPLFSIFHSLAMQTEKDRAKIIQLGIDQDKVKTLGNLKYDMALPALQGNSSLPDRAAYGIPENSIVWIAGSTHQGEEEIVFRVYEKIRWSFPDIFLMVAPRNIERGEEVQTLAGSLGLLPFRRTETINTKANVLVLDTLGELSGLYSLCDVVFMGGSLVPEGGHNPLEPACFAKPVVFGPHMEDFVEISRDLMVAGAASQVANEEELYESINSLVTDSSVRISQGGKGLQLVNKHQGVTAKHVAIIASIMEK